jgi:hypothetical protein
MSLSVEKGSRSLQMPDEPVRRSQRIAGQPTKEYFRTKKRAGTVQRGPEWADSRATVKKIKISRPPPSQAQKKGTVKKIKAGTEPRVKQAKFVPNSLQVEQQQQVKKEHEPRPATRRPPPRAAKRSRPLPADVVAGRPPSPHRNRFALHQQSETRNNPPSERNFQAANGVTAQRSSSRLSRAALRQLQSETANDPLPEEIQLVMLF